MVQNSPGSLSPTVSPVSGSMILISMWGRTRPTVPTFLSSGSSGEVCVDTGEVSVMPYPMVTSLMCISSTHCFMTSTGHGEPAIIPVRNDDRSNE